MMISSHRNNHYNAVVPVSWSFENPIYSQSPGYIENLRLNFVVMNMDPRDIPPDFQLTNVADRSRELAAFDQDLALAIAASRGIDQTKIVDQSRESMMFDRDLA